MFWWFLALYLWAGVSCFAAHLGELNRYHRYNHSIKAIAFFIFLIGWPLTVALRLIGEDD